jgi:prolyl-tRNA synthetase
MHIFPYLFLRACLKLKKKMQGELDRMFKETGHQNAYFPLFVPKSLFEAEEKNAEGFAKECAIVTHYRLENDPDNKGKLRVDPKAKLEEELIVRPTSEAIIWSTYKNWIQSYRDLPILINQWANVVRWEMRTRLFLRTAEFLWQEGHTAHETKSEALIEAEKMNSVYADFAENFMAIPVVKGLKSESERFAGAEETYCIEALMQDGKALQAGTSHFLGQNFAKAFDVKFTNKEGKLNYVWATSWGVSTRLMGALIMTHSDDKGLVLPPKLAPYQVVIVPIFKTDSEFDKISDLAIKITKDLQKSNISVKFDNRTTYRPGAKFAQHELQGVPLRIAIGPKDLVNKTVELSRRDDFSKSVISIDSIDSQIPKVLEDIQQSLFLRANNFRLENTTEVNSFEEFKEVLKNKGGFISAHWDGSSETENKIKQQTKATIRCIPLDGDKSEGKCVFSGKDSDQRVLFAKAY